MTDTPGEGPADGPSQDEEAASPKIRRKQPADGMKRGRIREIEKLMREGREDEIPPDELLAAQEGARRLRESMAQLNERLAPELSQLGSIARKLTQHNVDLSQVNASSWFEPERIELLAHQRPPVIEPPDMDGIAEGMAAAQAEKDAQVKRAQDTADETNNLLTELTRLMGSVESSNRNTERVIVEIKAHREQVAGQQDKQDKINRLLSLAAVLVGVGAIVVPLITSGG